MTPLVENLQGRGSFQGTRLEEGVYLRTKTEDSGSSGWTTQEVLFTVGGTKERDAVNTKEW